MPTVFAPVCVNANPIFQFKCSLSFLFVYLLAFFGAKTQAENNSMGIQFWSFHWHSYDMVILDWYQTVLSMTSVKKKLVKICVKKTNRLFANLLIMFETKSNYVKIQLEYFTVLQRLCFSPCTIKRVHFSHTIRAIFRFNIFLAKCVQLNEIKNRNKGSE